MEAGTQKTFLENLKKGGLGEQAVIEILSKKLQVRDLTDYTENKAYQQKGLDIEFLNTDTNAWDRADIKTNISETGLTFLELYKKEGILGWFHTTKSDWIICYSLVTEKIYYYNVNEMRNYINDRVSKSSIKMSYLRNGAIGVWLPVETNIIIKKFEERVA